MDARETLQSLRQSLAAKIIAYVLAALVLVSIGALWSPQSQEVNDLRSCIRQSEQLHESPDRCWPLVMKVK